MFRNHVYLSSVQFYSMKLKCNQPVIYFDRMTTLENIIFQNNYNNVNLDFSYLQFHLPENK